MILVPGMSGIACALQLQKNFNVKVFEKSRGVGGSLCAVDQILVIDLQ